MPARPSTPKLSLSGSWDWLVNSWQWPKAGLLCAVFLCGLLPLLLSSVGLALTRVFVQLPAYLIHQWEEHADDRFRVYFNARFGGGEPLLTRPATFWINLLGVWLLDTIASYLAYLVAPIAGLCAGYLSVVNGLSHLGQAVRLREYNPGLVTALLLLIPLGCWCIAVAGAHAGVGYHAIGAAVAVGLHVLIVLYCSQRMRILAAAG